MSLLDSSGRPLSLEPPKPERMVEICRSVSFRCNMGNYQHFDFFVSQKAQCLPEDADSVSADLYEWCFDEVMSSVRDVKAKQEAKERRARKEAERARRAS